MQFKKREKKMIGIELTPLIDIVFLLLLFFMVSTTFVNNPGIKVNLPQADSKPITKPEKSITVNVTANHQIFVNGKEIPASRLLPALQILAKKGTMPLMIAADGRAKHEMIVYVMDQAHQAGLTQLSITTQEKKR